VFFQLNYNSCGESAYTPSVGTEAGIAPETFIHDKIYHA
jgi:hypothetical protein